MINKNQRAMEMMKGTMMYAKGARGAKKMAKKMGKKEVMDNPPPSPKKTNSRGK